VIVRLRCWWVPHLCSRRTTRDCRRSSVVPRRSLLSHDQLLSEEKPKTLDQLWSALIRNAPDLETKLKYGCIFSLNGVSPNLLGAMAAIGGTTAPSVSFTLTKGRATVSLDHRPRSSRARTKAGGHRGKHCRQGRDELSRCYTYAGLQLQGDLYCFARRGPSYSRLGRDSSCLATDRSLSIAARREDRDCSIEVSFVVSRL